MSRTLIVSSRLPTKVLRTDEGLACQPSEGGRATGLGAIYWQGDNLWIGWPGLFVQDESEENHIRTKLRADNMAPVFLTEAEIRDFYEGFSNATLRPTFHYFSEFATYEQSPWEAYVRVNGKFCEAVLAEAGPEDTIWVHDYQLLLLPELLRGMLGADLIGFHTFGYLRHFLSAVSHPLGLSAQNGQIDIPTRSVRARELLSHLSFMWPPTPTCKCWKAIK